MPDRREPRIIPNLSSNSWLTPPSSKAREPIKRLMVKPMPHKAAVPYKDIQFMPFGKLQSFSFIASQHREKTPICFPTKRPTVMPSGTLCNNCSVPMPERLIPAFANAKTGKTKKATTG